MIMEHQKIINLLENEVAQSSKFRTKDRVEITNDACETYDNNNQNKFNAIMLKPSIYDYSDGYKLLNGTITGARKDVAVIQADERNFLPFTYCKSETNNTQIDNAKDMYVVISMYNLIEYSNILQKH